MAISHMAEPAASDPTLPIPPLGAGDLIDRAVRFYRGNFKTFLFIAAPPVILGTIVSVAWSTAARELFSVGPHVDPMAWGFYYVFLWIGSLVILSTELVSTLAVMGGASRNFVRHLLFGEEISFWATYRNTWGRLGGLVAASSMITFILGTVALIVFYIALISIALSVTMAVWAFSQIYILAFLVSLTLGTAIAAAAIWLYFLLASRFAYVPQVMMVEGHGPFSAIGRSASLASGNVKRLIALFFFTMLAAYSALALLYVPLLWYAWINGIELIGDADSIPASFEIASQLVWQASLILLSPVWMIGLCLLYVDERVRHEGYDIELAAARSLGDIPDVPTDYINPLQPALGSTSMGSAILPSRDDSRLTTLGLG